MPQSVGSLYAGPFGEHDRADWQADARTAEGVWELRRVGGFVGASG